MKKMLVASILPVVASMMIAPVAAQAAAPYKPVVAPAAQALVESIVAQNHDITLLGVHTMVPGTKDNVIVACNDHGRLGKPSSKGDMALIGKPKIVVAKLPAKKVYEVSMSLSDAQGKAVGMFVDQMDINAISNEGEAVNRALKIQAELQHGIASEEAMFAGS